MSDTLDALCASPRRPQRARHSRRSQRPRPPRRRICRADCRPHPSAASPTLRIFGDSQVRQQCDHEETLQTLFALGRCRALARELDALADRTATVVQCCPPLSSGLRLASHIFADSLLGRMCTREQTQFFRARGNFVDCSHVHSCRCRPQDTSTWLTTVTCANRSSTSRS